ncbi:hypothetical protein KQI52_01095 [bacterium]|nr:hypothetical protein [bacterium]
MKVLLIVLFLVFTHVYNCLGAEEKIEPTIKYIFGFETVLNTMPFGIYFSSLHPRKLGLYASVNGRYAAITSKGNYYEKLNEDYIDDTYNDVRGDTEVETIGGSIGLTKAIDNNAYIFVAGGMRYEVIYYEYFDRERSLGNDGHYWLKHEEKGKFSMKIGLIYKLPGKNTAMSLGFQSNPGSLLIGVAVDLTEFF